VDNAGDALTQVGLLEGGFPMSRRSVGWLILAVAGAVAVAPANVAAAQAAVPATAPALARIVILATGGTIAGAQPKEGEPGYRAGTVSIPSLVNAAAGLAKLASISGEQIANIGSQDMSDFVWLKLVRRARELLASPDVDGIVVTHGTDTLEETGFFLSLVLRSEKPVVLVGSMRPATSLSPDGPLNLYNAVAVAADAASRGRGVLVVVNDEVHLARAIQKSNTTAVQTFISPNRGKLGEAYYGKVIYFSAPAPLHTMTTAFSLDGINALPRVDIVYGHEGADDTFVKAAVAAGAKGIVLAGVGDGNATKEMIAALAEAAKRGVAVVRSTRVGSGIVRRNIELDDDALGFVAAFELNPQKARILLRMALTQTRDVREIQRLFEQF
jgi:L-asparaginase